MSATTLILLLLLLACPLSMLFMHRSGGHSHGSHDGSQPGADAGHGEGRETHGWFAREAVGNAETGADERRDAPCDCVIGSSPVAAPAPSRCDRRGALELHEISTRHEYP